MSVLFVFDSNNVLRSDSSLFSFGAFHDVFLSSMRGSKWERRDFISSSVLVFSKVIKLLNRVLIEINMAYLFN